MSSSTKFNPGDYLKGLGWKGEGTGLHEGSRAKPVTVAKKTSLSGLGKDRDVAFPWWEMVFKNVAGKVGASATEKKDDPHHRTTTGILSPLPPRPKADDYTPSTSSSGGINMDAFAAAKIEQARRQLYAGFLRGKVVGGTAEEAIKREAEAAAAAAAATEEKKGEGKKRKSNKSEAALEGKRIRKAIRAKRREARASATASAATSGAATPLETEEEEEDTSALGAPSISTSSTSKKRSRSPSLLTTTSTKKSRSSKSTKSSTSTPQHLSPEESLALDEEAYKAARKAAKEQEKEEKRLRKVARRALREENGKAE